MALNWSVNKVKDWETLSKDAKEWNITDALIWATMWIGMPEIKKSNAEEFYARVHLHELLAGTALNTQDGPYYLTKEDVMRRIGLSTNASSMTRHKFNSSLLSKYYKVHIKED